MVASDWCTQKYMKMRTTVCKQMTVSENGSNKRSRELASR